MPLLQANQLREVPASLGKLSRLRKLYLGNNQLQGVPLEFGSLTSLVELELRNNQITELPMTLSSYLSSTPTKAAFLTSWAARSTCCARASAILPATRLI